MLAGDLTTDIVEVGSECCTIPMVAEDTDQSCEVVFIDASLPDIELLAQGVDRSAEIVMLNPEETLIDQVSNYLSSRKRVSAIHVISHGRSGELHFGNQVLDAETLKQDADRIEGWNQSLTRGADILIYGCDVASETKGQNFVSLLAKLTGADVAASVDRTGSLTHDANWVLENHIGRIESSLAINDSARSRYRQTLNVTVNAKGSTGEEIAQLLIDDSVVAEWTVSTETQSFVYETNEAIQANRVKVGFTNDLYDFNTKFDRNLIVDKITIDDEFFESESERTFSTGNFVAGQGITPGFATGETLYVNGTFQYDQDPPLYGGISFDDRFWSKNPNAVAETQFGNLNLTTDGEDEAILWTDFDGKAGERYRLFGSATRRADGVGFGQAGRAAIGFDFFDENGNEIGEQFAEINEGFPFFEAFVDVPDGTAYSTIWIWVEHTGDERTATARINNIDITQVLASDTTPPTVELLDDNVVVTEETRQLRFALRYTDDTELVNPGSIFVIEPDGTNRGTNVFFLSGTNTEKPAELTYEKNRFGQLTSEDNGEYTLVLRGDSLRDRSGNAAPEQVLGTFVVDIPERGPDVTPPNVEFFAFGSQIPQLNQPAFNLEITDDESGLDLSSDNLVRVVGPNGEDQPTRRFSGAPTFNGVNISLAFTGNPEQPLTTGEYLVFAIADRIRDDAGNSLPDSLLGTFTYT